MCSLGVVEAIFRLKIKHPDRVYLLHGNHEDKGINFGGWSVRNSLSEECTNKYGNEIGEQVWDMINDVFEYLPLTAVIDHKTFCVHAGIPAASKENLSRPCTLREICEIPRIGFSKLEGLHAFIAENLLWNDYMQGDFNFIRNTARRLMDGRCFGNASIDRFLVENGLDSIIRAHDHDHAIFDGGGMVRDHHGRIITTLGTPDYLYQHNSGAVRNNGYALIVQGGAVVDIIELKHRD